MYRDGIPDKNICVKSKIGLYNGFEESGRRRQNRERQAAHGMEAL
jgi:hypothetical protein